MAITKSIRKCRSIRRRIRRIPIVAGLAAAGFVLAGLPLFGGVNVWTSNGPNSPIADLVMDPSNSRILYAAGGNGIFKSADDGGTWQKLQPDNPDLVGLTKIAIDPIHPQSIYAISSSAAKIFRSSDSGDHWTSADASGHVTSIIVDNDSAVYVGYRSSQKPEGEVYPAAPVSKSTDHGATWSATGLRTPRNVYALLADSLHGNVFVGSDAAYSRGYYGGFESSGGGVLRSPDGGRSWTGPNGDLGSQATSLALTADASTLYAGTSRGDLFRSINGGASWTLLWRVGGSITALTVDPTSASAVYVVTDSGIFRFSDDGKGPTWSAVNAGLLNHDPVAVVADPTGPFLHAATPFGVFDIEIAPDLTPCHPDVDRLCLLRFRAEVAVTDPHTGALIHGYAIPKQRNFGYFSFPSLTGDSTLPEVFVKIVDAASLPGGGFWVYYGGLTDVPYSLTITDTVTGRRQEYDGENLCGGGDISSFPADPISSGEASRADEARFTATGNTLSLLSNRFRLELSAVDPQTSQSVTGRAIPGDDRFGYFSLPGVTGDPNFPEVFVKMIDATSLPDGSFWLYHTGLTSLFYVLTVTDTKTGVVKNFWDQVSDPTHTCGAADTGAFQP